MIIFLLNRPKNQNNSNQNSNSNQIIEKNEDNSIPVAMPEVWDWNVWNN